MELVQSLEQLVEDREHHGISLRSFLQPGLARSEVEENLEKLNLSGFSDLFTLYEWHNGINREKSDVPMFGEHIFFSLADSLRTYHRIVQYYSDPLYSIDIASFFPIAGYSGSYYAVFCDDTPLHGLIHPVVRIFQGVEIEFESIEKMVITANEWSRSGVYDRSPVDSNLISAILRRLNSRIPYQDTTF